jgi:exopolyphosphatase/guanosine-5'-triphosphate,3'-diphosphate pyrophosphatase
MTLTDVLPSGNYSVFDQMSETIKFFEDTSDNFIKPAKINDALTILKMYKTICDVNKVTDVIAVAAHSVRNMKNQRSFFEEVYTACGFKFKILTAEEEVMAVYTGVINTLDIPKGLVINITGSATNFVYYNRRNVLNQATIPVGAYSLTQMFGSAKEEPHEVCKRMVEYFKNELKSIPWLENLDPEYAFVGAGQAFLNIGKLSRKLKRYPLDLEHNYVLSKEDIKDVYDLIAPLDLDKTKKIKGISGDRADVLASGVCIARAVADFVKLENITISEKEFKEGILFNKAVPVTNEKPISDLLGFSLDTINGFYGKKENNAKQVGELALILFRQLKVLHKLPRGYLKVLRIASIMYDCGERIRFKNHEKNSFNIILNSDIQGASQREIVLAAFVASSQDVGDFSVTEWVKYQSLFIENEDLAAVKKLAIVVRIAEALDKTHRSLVQDISCDVLGDSVIMKTIVTGDASIEVREALKVGLDFRRVYGKNLEVL